MELLQNFLHEVLAATGTLVISDLPWLLPAMVVIFGLVQFLKILIAALQRKKKHGLPNIAIISGVLVIGILYSWGAGYRHHHPCSFAMVIEGIGLGATNIALYHCGQFLFWLFTWRNRHRDD